MHRKNSLNAGKKSMKGINESFIADKMIDTDSDSDIVTSSISESDLGSEDEFFE